MSKEVKPNKKKLSWYKRNRLPKIVRYKTVFAKPESKLDNFKGKDYIYGRRSSEERLIILEQLGEFFQRAEQLGIVRVTFSKEEIEAREHVHLLSLFRNFKRDCGKLVIQGIPSIMKFRRIITNISIGIGEDGTSIILRVRKERPEIRALRNALNKLPPTFAEPQHDTTQGMIQAFLEGSPHLERSTQQRLRKKEKERSLRELNIFD